MRLASYLCSTPQYKKRNVYRHDPGFPTNHMLRYKMVPQIALPARYTTIRRFGFVVGALSSLRLSVMLTQITIQDSNTVIWQVIRLHVYYTTNLHVNLWTAHAFNISIFVGRRGFEPRTPASSVQCSTNWAIGPIKLFYKWKAVKPP